MGANVLLSPPPPPQDVATNLIGSDSSPQPRRPLLHLLVAAALLGLQLGVEHGQQRAQRIDQCHRRFAVLHTAARAWRHLDVGEVDHATEAPARERGPFEPFRIKLVNGDAHDIFNPQTVALQRSALAIASSDQNWVLFPLDKVNSVESLIADYHGELARHG